MAWWFAIYPLARPHISVFSLEMTEMTMTNIGKEKIREFWQDKNHIRSDTHVMVFGVFWDVFGMSKAMSVLRLFLDSPRFIQCGAPPRLGGQAAHHVGGQSAPGLLWLHGQNGTSTQDHPAGVESDVE